MRVICRKLNQHIMEKSRMAGKDTVDRKASARQRLTWVVALLVLALFTPALAANFQAGMAAYERGDWAAALREFYPLAEQGYAEAQHRLV